MNVGFGIYVTEDSEMEKPCDGWSLVGTVDSYYKSTNFPQLNVP